MAWRSRQRGVVEVVTGGGKTVFAQLCLQEFFSVNPRGQALVVVPTISLLDQWCVALQEEMGMTAKEIGLLSGQERAGGEEPVIIAVVNSARGFVKNFSMERSLFLIVDECHRTGSPANAAVLEGRFAATLGLSATPVREYDDGFERFIEPALGPIIYKYDYTDAARDGVVAALRLRNVRIDFLPEELVKYQRLSRAIAAELRRRPAEGAEEKLKRLLRQRAAVSADALGRIPVAVKLAELHKDERVVVFHERIEGANRLVAVFNARGRRVTLYHTGIGPSLRRDNLRLFRRGLFDILVCCRGGIAESCGSTS